MSYDTVKNGIANIVKLLAYTESQQVVDFTDASANEYGNTFILKCLSGEQVDPDTETLVNRFYDYQKWQVQIAFEKSAQSDVANLDELHRRKDDLLRELDDPTNWTSYVRMQKVKSWNVQEFKSYYVLTIELKVIDTYTY